VSRLICPIGIAGISSKLPGAIAVAIAAQLLQQQRAAEPDASTIPQAEMEPPGCDGACGSCSR
jgi:xanthine/CO dehydrogenase XdhC/CoxF family maturation factor